jgi:circadian clock protein KaiC
MKAPSVPTPSLAKAATGIQGLDEITHGGLPRGRTTLIQGGPGCGKTILSLQALASGVRLHDEPGIFVAFEESTKRILANAEAFGWDLPELQKQKLFFVESLPNPDLVQSGDFDLQGMLAALSEKAREASARRIVFDAVDVLLALLNDEASERREVYRLHEWLLRHELTSIITAKSGGYETYAANRPQLGFMQFMVDCAVVLKHEVISGVSERSLRVVKYRGSAFAENEAPFLIGAHGLEVASAHEMHRIAGPVSAERISTGVERLDTMLDGGYYRAATVLITGFPGTAKSTLCGAFAEAACARGERSLFISFDSDAAETMRNFASVGIQLERFVEKGILRLVLARAITGSPEAHLMQIKNFAREQQARCMIIDPVSSLLRAGRDDTVRSVVERLIDWSKVAGITLICTALLERAAPEAEGTPIKISTLADTWIHLHYLVSGGERNRGLSIVKSRGTAHSNQVRELVLSKDGVTLADAYTTGGEVLMGTLRWEKEDAERVLLDKNRVAAELKWATIESEEAILEVRLKALQLELRAKQTEKEALSRVSNESSADQNRGKTRLQSLRGLDKP